MSHEWNCRCPRCEADEAKYTGPDDEGEAERRYGGGERESALAFLDSDEATVAEVTRVILDECGGELENATARMLVAIIAVAALSDRDPYEVLAYTALTMPPRVKALAKDARLAD